MIDSDEKMHETFMSQARFEPATKWIKFTSSTLHYQTTMCLVVKKLKI